MGRDFDVLFADASFFVPYPAYCVLRNEAPVFWSHAWGAWVLTRFDDVVNVLTAPSVFSSAGRVLQLPDEQHALLDFGEA